MRKFMEGNATIPSKGSKKVQKVVASEGSKSSKVKELFDMGLEVKDIASLLDIRYNFAYNVISNYINLNDIQVISERAKGGKKDDVVQLAAQGLKPKEIAKQLKTNINYVYKILKTTNVEAQSVEQEVATSEEVQ